MRKLYIAATLAFAPSFVHADDSILWKKVGAWTVAADTSLDNNCFAAVTDSHQNSLRIGFAAGGSLEPLYLLAGRADWKSLQTGNDYPVMLRFDRKPPLQLTASAEDFHGEAALRAKIGDIGYLDDLKHSRTLDLASGDQIKAEFALKGSSRAVDELKLCQKTVNNWKEPEEKKEAVKPNEPRSHKTLSRQTFFGKAFLRRLHLVK